MANHVSAEKRNRQRIVRTARNRAIKSSVRTKIKRFRTTLQASKPDVALSQLRDAVSALDRAASKGAIHRKAASRAKSRIARALHNFTSSTQATQTTTASSS